MRDDPGDGPAADGWVAETLYPSWGQRFVRKAEIARVRSPFQDIHLFDTESHGRVLMLDGVVQITEGTALSSLGETLPV